MHQNKFYPQPETSEQPLVIQQYYVMVQANQTVRCLGKTQNSALKTVLKEKDYEAL